MSQKEKENSPPTFLMTPSAGSSSSRAAAASAARGLGLSIVKSFVELHGGTVEIRGGGEPGAEITSRVSPCPGRLPHRGGIELMALRLSRFLADEQATALWAEDCPCAETGRLPALVGRSGCGKTTLARAIIRTLCNDPLMDVPSPTFTLVQAYDGRVPVAHFDLYRIAQADELDELGLDEALLTAAALVEGLNAPKGACPPAPSKSAWSMRVGKAGFA